MERTLKPLIPMGAITGRPTREELIETLESYRKVGIEQFLIYPRSGLEVEYMGPEWLEICRHIFEYCDEHGMAVWLYDEYNWPSGKCKGKVIRENPDFASKKLVAFSERNSCRSENQDVPEEEFFWTEVSIPLYADILDPDAVDCFIRLTHEFYFQHFGSYFGKTIRGIFSDEPSFSYVTYKPLAGNVLEIPYYRGLKEDYLQATGHFLTDDLEEDLRSRTPEHLWETFHFLLEQRFRHIYLDRIRKWCDAHHILFTGHLMEESNLSNSIAYNGRPTNAIRGFSMPGMDEIFSYTSFEKVEWNTFKLLESAMNGPRTDALAELFALGPADIPFVIMREMIYLTAIHGVNHFVTAVSALDARGNVEKPIYYNPISPAQPWFRHIGILNDTAEKAASLTRKKSTASMALRFPQRASCPNWVCCCTPALTVDYSELVRALINAQWEFRLIGDDEVAEKSYRVVLNLIPGGAEEERTGTHFGDIAGILDFLEKNQTRRARLRFRDGRPVERVLLKTYDDATVCIVNTSSAPLSNISLDGKDFFELERDGVALFPEPVESRPEKVMDLSGESFLATLEHPNSMRCIFASEKEWRFEVAGDTEAVLALRNYGGRVEVELDGNTLIADASCKTMPEGFRQLYRESKVIPLKSGAHILRLTSGVPDIPYLPAAILFGRFSWREDGVLRSLPQEPLPAKTFFAEHGKEFTGTVVFQKENLDFSEYDAIAFECRELAVEAFLDGKSLGVRLWAPFVWDIPEALRKGGSKLELHVTTSIGPLFGNYPDYLSADDPLRNDSWFKNYWPGKKG